MTLYSQLLMVLMITARCFSLLHLKTTTPTSLHIPTYSKLYSTSSTPTPTVGEDKDNDTADHSIAASSLIIELESVIKKGPIDESDQEFLINGWRWHTSSVIRDLSRFSNVINTISKDLNSTEEKSEEQRLSILRCYKFVFDFNWKALMKVERELFFPWLRSLLPDSAAPLIEDILAQHSSIIELSLETGTICQRMAEENYEEITTSEEITKDFEMLGQLLHKLMQCASKIQKVQEQIFVPYIAAYVNKKDQEFFNRKVIKRLGLLDSQVHLVSMSEAISDDPVEMSIFKRQIPRIAQVLLPIWRRQLYYPRAQCLEKS